jgi:hypothetical protein
VKGLTFDDLGRHGGEAPLAGVDEILADSLVKDDSHAEPLKTGFELTGELDGVLGIQEASTRLDESDRLSLAVMSGDFLNERESKKSVSKGVQSLEKKEEGDRHSLQRILYR